MPPLPVARSREASSQEEDLVDLVEGPSHGRMARCLLACSLAGERASAAECARARCERAVARCTWSRVRVITCGHVYAYV
eukprot:4840532-Prymnesium_polylepis.2